MGWLWDNRQGSCPGSELLSMPKGSVVLAVEGMGAAATPFYMPVTRQAFAEHPKLGISHSFLSFFLLLFFAYQSSLSLGF